MAAHRTHGAQCVQMRVVWVVLEVRSLPPTGAGTLAAQVDFGGQPLSESSIKGRRSKIHRLDVLIQALEDANERGETHPSDVLARQIQTEVGGVIAGASVSQALNFVFDEQQRWLTPTRLTSTTALEPRRTSEAAPLEGEDARRLTRQIREELAPGQRPCLRLLEAHDRRAWSVLGYASWGAYVHEELHLSRSRSYELLDQARMIETMRTELGLSGIPDIRPYWAVDLKPAMETVVRAIRSRLDGLKQAEECDRLRVVQDVVREEHRNHILQRQTERSRTDPDIAGRGVADDSPAPGNGTPDLDMDRFLDVIGYLAALPAPEELAISVGRLEADMRSDLERAVSWLQRFACLQDVYPPRADQPRYAERLMASA
jgi:hypothetical protein